MGTVGVYKKENCHRKCTEEQDKQNYRLNNHKMLMDIASHDFLVLGNCLFRSLEFVKMGFV